MDKLELSTDRLVVLSPSFRGRCVNLLEVGQVKPLPRADRQDALFEGVRAE